MAYVLLSELFSPKSRATVFGVYHLGIYLGRFDGNVVHVHNVAPFFFILLPYLTLLPGVTCKVMITLI